MAEFALADTMALLRQLPKEAQTWMRSAQKKAFIEYRDNPGYPGVPERFSQKSNEMVMRGRTFLPIAEASRGRYHFSTRGYALRGKVLDRNAKRSYERFVQLNHGSPPYVYSGAMKREISRRPPRTRFTGNEVRTTFSLNARALNLFGGKHGVARKEMTTKAVTFSMRSYRDSVGRTGAFQMQVTRNVKTFRIVFATTTYLQEWEWRPDEIRWCQERANELLVQIVRGAVFTGGGRLRGRFTTRLGVYA